MVDPACEPASPGPCPVLRFFAALGPDAIEAQGSGAVWKSGVVEATHAHASAKPPGVTPSGPATSSSSSHQPAESITQPQQASCGVVTHQLTTNRETMAERHANHAISDHANRQQLPIASDTAPENEANLIPHECGSNRPSSNLDATENSEAEPSNECEERPERKRALSTPASKQAPANMADSHHGTNKFSNDQHALKKDEGCRFSGGEAWQDPDKTNKASMAYFCEIYLSNGGARTQFIRQGLRQNDPFVFPRFNYFNQDDTRLFNACMLELCASMDAAPACPAEPQQEPLQEINTQAKRWRRGRDAGA